MVAVSGQSDRRTTTFFNSGSGVSLGADSRGVKTYRQFCGVAKALDVLGERWTLLLVRDLVLGPRTFTDLERSLYGITPNLLSKRLELLQANAIIARVKHPASRSGHAYALTDRGRTLEGVVLGLGAFGAAYLVTPKAGDRLDPRSAALALKRRYSNSKTAGSVELVMGDDHFAVQFGGSRIDVRDGSPDSADVVLTGTPTSWFPLLSRQATLRELEQHGQILRHGPIRIAAAFVRAIGALA